MTSGERFRALHERRAIFVMPNAWDAGSARALSRLGFEALGTSSAATAAMLGVEDGAASRATALENAKSIMGATDLPVSADFGCGFGDDPSAAAETVRMAGSIGLAGCSIEDAVARRGGPQYDLSQAVERVAAAVEAGRTLPAPFTLTARAENFIRDNPDLDDTIERLRAYERAGADVLFAPGLPSLEAVRTVCSALTKPVSFMAGIPRRSFTVRDLESAGVRRISLGGSLYRAAMAGVVTAAREVLETGTFTYTDP
jgi:2-methylisocitrate lyase-like PEP mutase family enzyme